MFARYMYPHSRERLACVVVSIKWYHSDFFFLQEINQALHLILAVNQPFCGLGLSFHSFSDLAFIKHSVVLLANFLLFPVALAVEISDLQGE